MKLISILNFDHRNEIIRSLKSSLQNHTAAKKYYAYFMIIDLVDNEKSMFGTVL